jgi:hypothetical protein
MRSHLLRIFYCRSRLHYKIQPFGNCAAIFTETFLTSSWSCHPERSEGSDNINFNVTEIPNEVRDLRGITKRISLLDKYCVDVVFEIPRFVRDFSGIAIKITCPSLRSG